MTVVETRAHCSGWTGSSSSPRPRRTARSGSSSRRRPPWRAVRAVGSGSDWRSLPDPCSPGSTSRPRTRSPARPPAGAGGTRRPRPADPSSSRATAGASWRCGRSSLTRPPASGAPIPGRPSPRGSPSSPPPLTPAPTWVDATRDPQGVPLSAAGRPSSPPAHRPSRRRRGARNWRRSGSSGPPSPGARRRVRPRGRPGTGAMPRRMPVLTGIGTGRRSSWRSCRRGW